MYIGIIVKDREACLRVLLKSLQPVIENVRIVDASEMPLYQSVKDLLPGVKRYIHNSFQNYKAVNHNKNILIHDFLRSGEDYLFLIEDDTEILDCSVFQKYIETSKKYNIPHFNAILPAPKGTYIKYTLRDEIDVCNMLYGFFSFYTRECLETAGLYSANLSNQCWEHIHHTAKIHKYFNYTPEFFHFLDIKDSFKYLKYQGAPSVIKTNRKTIEKDKKKMFAELGWKNFPKESIKKLDLAKFINI
jgi:hypothetical protein